MIIIDLHVKQDREVYRFLRQCVKSMKQRNPDSGARGAYRYRYSRISCLSLSGIRRMHDESMGFSLLSNSQGGKKILEVASSWQRKTQIHRSLEVKARDRREIRVPLVFKFPLNIEFRWSDHFYWKLNMWRKHIRNWWFEQQWVKNPPRSQCYPWDVHTEKQSWMRLEDLYLHEMRRKKWYWSAYMRQKNK